MYMNILRENWWLKMIEIQDDYNYTMYLLLTDITEAKMFMMTKQSILWALAYILEPNKTLSELCCMHGVYDILRDCTLCKNYSNISLLYWAKRNKERNKSMESQNFFVIDEVVLHTTLVIP